MSEGREYVECAGDCGRTVIIAEEQQEEEIPILCPNCLYEAVGGDD